MNDSSRLIPMSEEESSRTVGGLGPITIGLFMLVIAECVHYSTEFKQGLQEGWAGSYG